jgi:hypothetical protein
MHKIVVFLEHQAKRLLNGAVFQITDLQSL